MSEGIKLGMKVAQDKRPIVIFVLGGPGAGKGTQCALISKHYGYHHISAGDCLREERARCASEYGTLIEQYIRDGKIVPVEITCALLRNKMRECGWENQKFLIDGFPRNVDNLNGWFAVSGDDVHTASCLNIDCPEDVMEKRLLSRGATSGRIDDNIESVLKRFKTFQTETLPVLKHFKAENKCVVIQGDQPVEAVWNDVRNFFDQLSC